MTNPFIVAFIHHIHFKDQNMIYNWFNDAGIDGVFHIEDDTFVTFQVTFSRELHKEARNLIQSIKKLNRLRSKRRTS